MFVGVTYKEPHASPNPRRAKPVQERLLVYSLDRVRCVFRSCFPQWLAVGRGAC